MLLMLLCYRGVLSDTVRKSIRKCVRAALRRKSLIASRLVIVNLRISKIVSEYDQEIPQSQTASQPTES